MNKITVLNRRNSAHGMSIFLVRPRDTAEHNSGLQILRDIASFTGIKTDNIVDGGSYKNIGIEHFGTCQNLKVTTTNTAFLGRAEKHWVETRIQQNLSIKEEGKSLFDKEITGIRNAELAEGLVTVEIGGGLMPDLEERADRFDDAAKAAKAASVSGALPGSGLSYIRAGQLAGVDSRLQEALTAINRKVLDNYGTDFKEISPKQGEAYCISDSGITVAQGFDTGVLDACETVTAVIKNGVALGVKVATIGGFYLVQK